MPKKPTKAQKAKARKAQHEAEALASSCFWSGLGLGILGVPATFLTAGAGSAIVLGGLSTVALGKAAEDAAKAAKKIADDPPVPYPDQDVPFIVIARDVSSYIDQTDAHVVEAVTSIVGALDYLEAYAETAARAAHAADTESFDDLEVQIGALGYYGGRLVGKLDMLHSILPPLLTLFETNPITPKHLYKYVSAMKNEGMEPELVAVAMKGLRMTEDDIKAYRKRVAAIDAERVFENITLQLSQLTDRIASMNATARELSESFVLDVMNA